MTPVSYIQFRTLLGELNVLQKTPAATERISEAFAQARRTATALDAYPGELPETLEAAYACQDAALARWPDPVTAWKVARIPPALVERLQEGRLIGPVFARNVHYASGTSAVDCAVFEGGFAAVETEVVILVGADAPANKTSWTLDEAREYVGEMRIGIEIASSPLKTLNDLGPTAVISDFGNNWGIVIGETRIADWNTRRSPIECETFVDGVSVGRRGVSIEEGPLAAFAFTLGKGASRGRPLRRGTVITTGMITGVHDVRAGQRSRHVFDGYGEVHAHIVRAKPLAQ